VRGGSDIRAVLARHAGELMAVRGVVGVAVGERGGEPCLHVLVERSTSEVEDRVPSSIEGFTVEIRETGELRSKDPSAPRGDVGSAS
jgi:hypothetical protein